MKLDKFIQENATDYREAYDDSFAYAVSIESLEKLRPYLELAELCIENIDITNELKRLYDEEFSLNNTLDKKHRDNEKKMYETYQKIREMK